MESFNPMVLERHVWVFVDTNVLLHYPPLRNLDWINWCDCDAVTLVLCMPVIDELDEKKTHPLLSDRATRAIKEIETYAGQEIREHVKLIILEDEQPSGGGDTRIIDAVTRYKRNFEIEVDVRICSEDLGMSVRCRGRGISVLKPDKALELPAPQNEAHKKIQSLSAELAQLKTSMPDLTLIATAPGSTGNPPNLELSRSNLRLSQLLQQEATTFGVRLLDPESSTGLYSVQDFEPLNARVPQSFARYAPQLANYLRSHRQWIAEQIPILEASQRVITFNLELQNTGSSPAENVEVTVHFPPVFSFIKVGHAFAGSIPKFGARIKAPQVPPGLASEGAQPIRDPFDALHKAQERAYYFSAPVVKIEGDRENGFILRYQKPLIVHHRHENWGELTTAFDSWENAKSFNAQVSISAGNIPKKIERSIPFIIKCKLAST